MSTAPRESTGNSDVHQRTADLYERIAAARAESNDAVADAARAELIELHLPLAEYLARRFSNRGEPQEDLAQVASIGLIKAIDNFDVDRGLAFSTYATPTILGEVKRHFRDRGWTIRVPRRLQELHGQLNRASQELGQDLGRSPTVPELAAHLGVSEEEIVEGLDSGNAYSPMSLDAPDPEGEMGSAIDRLGASDASFEAIVDRETLKPLLDALDPRAKRILMLRFFEHKTQSQIADELGISQMHVSRLLSKTLADLRSAATRE